MNKLPWQKTQHFLQKQGVVSVERANASVSSVLSTLPDLAPYVISHFRIFKKIYLILNKTEKNIRIH